MIYSLVKGKTVFKRQLAVQITRSCTKLKGTVSPKKLLNQDKILILSILYSNLLNEIGHFFLDIQYLLNLNQHICVTVVFLFLLLQRSYNSVSNVKKMTFYSEKAIIFPNFTSIFECPGRKSIPIESVMVYLLRRISMKHFYSIYVVPQSYKKG